MFSVVPLDEVREAIRQEWPAQLTKIKELEVAMVKELQKQMQTLLAAELAKVKESLLNEINLGPRPPTAAAARQRSSGSASEGVASVAPRHGTALRRENHKEKSERKNRPKRAMATHATARVEVELKEELKRSEEEQTQMINAKTDASTTARDLALSVSENNAAVDKTQTEPAAAPLLPREPSPVVIPPGAETPLPSPLREIRHWIEQENLESAAAIAVVLNMLALGLSTDWSLRNKSYPMFSHCTEMLFCIFFVTELSLRMWYDGWREFYTNDDRGWAILDTCLVVMQVMDQFCVLVDVESEYGKGTSTIRVVRIFRVLRILRTLRMFHLSSTLSANVTAIASSFMPACWSFVIFSLMIYTMTVMLLQLALTYDSASLRNSDLLQEWFPDLNRAMLTVFQVFTFGLDWNEIVEPLFADINGVVGSIFCLMVVLGLFVTCCLILNVFSDRIMKTVREDKDTDTVQHISKLFIEDSGSISWSTFAAKIGKPAMISFFESIDVCPSVDQARGLFELIDSDGSGSVDQQEIISGCLRLRGPARALDMAVVQRDVGAVLANVNSLFAMVGQVQASVTSVNKILNEAEAAAKKKDSERAAARAAARAEYVPEQ